MPETLAADLLDSKNDYVFFRVFSEEPALLVDLINVVRRDEPAIVEVSLLNPRLTPERLSGKSLVLDLRAVDERGQRYTIEMQVRRFTHWSGRGLLYLARLLSEQLDAGTAYRRLKPVIGIHLLDFTLFEAPEQAKQALWCFEMRDRARPEVRLGRELQLNIIELRKADRLGQLPARLSAWIADFEHWQEESTMSTHPYPPVQRAIEKLRELSADEEARYWAESRAKALSDEASLLAEAREEGREEGEQLGLQKGREDTARNLIALGVLTVGQIAQATGLSLAQIEALRTAGPQRATGVDRPVGRLGQEGLEITHARERDGAWRAPSLTVGNGMPGHLVDAGSLAASFVKSCNRARTRHTGGCWPGLA